MLLVVGFSSELPAQTTRVPRSWASFLVEAEKLRASQLLLVNTLAPGCSRAELHCLERHAGSWRFARPAMAASVGRNGIADPGVKREGDGMSPYGTFPVGLAFGYQSTCSTRMPYRQMSSEDVWVDDPSAIDYNCLTHINFTRARSFEHMRRNDELYKKGLVVEYNTDPIVAGLGSAIFVHIWGRPFSPTSGCLGLPEHHLETVLGFLDPEKAPVITFSRNDLR